MTEGIWLAYSNIYEYNKREKSLIEEQEEKNWTLGKQ
jgi:hypothetical protein